MPPANTDVALIIHQNIPPANGYILSYSGGKDSLAVLDVTVQTGKPVVAFFMYYVPNMDFTRYWCDFARLRWGIKVLEYQHWGISHNLREGLFRARPMAGIPLLKVGDIERLARRDSGLWWIGYGYKKCDSLERRGMITGWYNKWGRPWDEKRGVYAPLDEWSDRQVKEYLTSRDIPVPGLSGAKSNGISLAPRELAWLRDEWPDDYKRVLKYFPYAVGQADRVPMLDEYKEQKRAEMRAARKAAKENEPNPTPDV